MEFKKFRQKLGIRKIQNVSLRFKIKKKVHRAGSQLKIKKFTDMINNKNDELVKANLLRQVTNILSLTKSEAGKISKLKVIARLLFSAWFALCDE